jgi:8-oxo-dGTP diphosphatase
MTTITQIGIAIVEHADRFLVGVRGEDSPLPGKAEFPGGKCDPDETPADCAIRECWEEVGLEVRLIRLLDTRTHSYPHGTVELHFWLCEVMYPEEVSEDHYGFRWVSRRDLKTLDFPEANEHIIALLTEARFPTENRDDSPEIP